MAVEASGVVALLWVYDMPRSIHFYRDKLGAEVTNTSEVAGEDQFDWAMLRLGYARFMLNTIYDSDDDRPTVAPSPEAQSQRDVWMYFDCKDVDAVYAELRGRNVDVSAPVATYWGMKQVFVADPDGYRVCFQCPAES
jgi:catechol 2,3-dioxygenase-like lactoylglutathione lyase family enzyme